MSDQGDDKPVCFIIMPMTVPKLHKERYQREDHFDMIRTELFEPAIRKAGFEPKKPGAEGSENIQASIINDLRDAELVLADLSCLNANVFLELGIRTALDGPMCLIYDGRDALPFDTGTINSHEYMPLPGYELNRQIDSLTAHIVSTVERHGGRNQLWRYFGTAVDLQTLDAASINPDDVTEAAKIDRLTDMVETLIRQDSRPHEAPAGGRYFTKSQAKLNNDMEELLRSVNSRLAISQIPLEGVTVSIDDNGAQLCIDVSVSREDWSDGREKLLRRTLSPVLVESGAALRINYVP